MVMGAIDWSAMWSLEHALEVVVRGTVVYLALFVVMRLIPRRTIGGVGPSDLLVVVLIADAVQNAMAGGYQSLADGLVLAAVIFGWAALIDWLDYRFPSLRLSGAREVKLVQDGRILRKNLAREQMSEEELMSQLRLNGVAELDKVRAAYLEPEGHVSVIVSTRSTRPQRRRSG